MPQKAVSSYFLFRRSHTCYNKDFGLLQWHPIGWFHGAVHASDDPLALDPVGGVAPEYPVRVGNNPRALCYSISTNWHTGNSWERSIWFWPRCTSISLSDSVGWRHVVGCGSIYNSSNTFWVDRYHNNTIGTHYPQRIRLGSACMNLSIGEKELGDCHCSRPKSLFSKDVTSETESMMTQLFVAPKILLIGRILVENERNESMGKWVYRSSECP